MPSKFKFTNDNLVKFARPPGKKDVYSSGKNKGKQKSQMIYTDTDLHGFYCVVGRVPSDDTPPKRTFAAQSYLKGRTVRVTIGTFPPMTAHTARTEAKSVLVDMQQGINPNEEKKKSRTRGVTLCDAWEMHEYTLRSKKRSQKTIDGYEYCINHYLNDWIDRPLAEISRKDVNERHKKIAEDVVSRNGSKIPPGNALPGTYAANSAMRAFRTVYNRAAKQHEELPTNPCVNVDWFIEDPKKSAIPSTQLRQWYSEVMTINNPIRRDYFLVVLFTGMRRRSTAAMRWADVDLENKLLHVPKPKGGEKKAFTIPLSDYLCELLENRKKENEDIFPNSPWVFPAAISKSGHISNPKVRLSVPFSIHDLRRTFITVAESIDVSPYSIKALANHGLPKHDVTAGYVSLDPERLREPMEQITAKLLTLLDPDND